MSLEGPSAQRWVGASSAAAAADAASMFIGKERVLKCRSGAALSYSLACLAPT